MGNINNVITNLYKWILSKKSPKKQKQFYIYIWKQKCAFLSPVPLRSPPLLAVLCLIVSWSSPLLVDGFVSLNLNELPSPSFSFVIKECGTRRLGRLMACHYAIPPSPTILLFLLNLRESKLEQTEMCSMLLRACVCAGNSPSAWSKTDPSFDTCSRAGLA